MLHLKKLTQGALLVLAMSLTTVVSAVSNAPQKIGVVDKIAIMNDSLYAKDMIERFNTKFKKRQEVLQSKEKVINAKYEALKRDADVISEQEKTKKERELLKLREEYTLLARDYQEDAKVFERDNMHTLEKTLSKVLDQIVKAEKLDLIIPKNLAMYTTGKFDYTYKALEYLDKDFKENNANTK